MEGNANYFFINADYSLVKINFADVVWVDALKDYLRIHLNNNSKPVVAQMSMRALEEQLPAASFLRIHKSYLVSKEYITSLKKSSVFIQEIELPAGDTYKESILQYVNMISRN